jgi:mycothiol system anti-sigma-R factor
MDCKDTNSYLCSYLDGELDFKTCQDIEEHLRDCKICRNDLEIQRSAKLLIQKRLKRFSAPASLKSRISFELSRADEYKESGITTLDLIRWGTHVAQFYNTKSDLTDLLVPYLGEGLKDNELCVWITGDMTKDEVKNAFAKTTPNLREYLNKDQLQIFSYKDWYLAGGYFDVNNVLNSAVSKYQDALSIGYSGFRAIGVISWLEKSDWNAFMEYEQILNNFMPDQKVLIICAYKESKCTSSNVYEVMNRHKYSISKLNGSWKLMKPEKQPIL